jgi:Domain of unknown function (DUF4386)
MNTAVISERIANNSPHFKVPNLRVPGFKVPRLRTTTAGVLYLFGVMTAALVETSIRGRLTVAGGLIAVCSMIAVTLLFYDTLSTMNRRLALLAALFNIVGLAFESLRLQPQGVNVAVVFDGFYCILIGCLAFRSTFLPRILGALMALGGLGWLTLLSSRLANYSTPYNLAFGLLGEAAVCSWLVVTGANAQRRKPRAAQRSGEAVRI